MSVHTRAPRWRRQSRSTAPRQDDCGAANSGSAREADRYGHPPGPPAGNRSTDSSAHSRRAPATSSGFPGRSVRPNPAPRLPKADDPLRARARRAGCRSCSADEACPPHRCASQPNAACPRRSCCAAKAQCHCAVRHGSTDTALSSGWRGSACRWGSPHAYCRHAIPRPPDDPDGASRPRHCHRRRGDRRGAGL
ncbi:hypothetical protein D3C87_1457640 [compost metagenome]